MKSTLLIPILLSLAACASVRVPPHEAPSRFGVVHAADPATARDHARVLDDVGPFVASAIPGLRVEPVDLRIVGTVGHAFDAVPHLKVCGAVIEHRSAKWVEMRSDLEPAARRGVLAHELVHRWLGPAWKTLPPAIEDGLCDLVADAIRENDTPRERMVCFLTSWITLNGELTVDPNAAPVAERNAPFTVSFRSNAAKLTPALILEVMARDLESYHSLDRPRFTVVGILSRLILSRVSVDQLFDLCLEAGEEGLTRVPPARIFAAAGLDPLDLEDWNALLLATYGRQERQALREEIPADKWNVHITSETEGLEFGVHLRATVDF